MTITIEDITAAEERIDQAAGIRRTPVQTSTTLGDRLGADVRLKAEHLQKTGSFKPRGAFNAIHRIAGGDADRVVAASAGNHAQGVAYAATELGLESLIVMPETAPQAKVDATEGYGATVRLEGDTFAEAMAAARSAATESDTEFVHAYDDPDVVAGQGTIGLELLEQVPEMSLLTVPIGGGGLIGGIATAVTAIDDSVRIVGVQAESAATVPQSLDKGYPVANETPDTIADGIATGSVSDLTFDIISERVDEVVTVTDTEIAQATLFLLERTKQLVEGAAAAAVAPLLSGTIDCRGETVVPVLGGGNIDVATLQDILTRALVDRRLFVTLTVRIDDRPGVLGEVAEIIGDHDTNVRSVRHDRSEEGLPVGKADLVIRMTTPGTAAIDRIIGDIEAAGYTIKRVVPTGAPDE
ncbi:threonine dehydratase [Halopenitus malekzadehii]|uniref:threonine ammonia-lyase n=1 Tax=Halopenitus malekzadehii TaxID=1267564 RepID=A0A1H6I1I6_9EURY|nr:threonine ammonia-lyase [Halopenitus malekzadehii]SEH41298.1 threonine dehydratase [Halopenitus malekzadehii]